MRLTRSLASMMKRVFLFTGKEKLMEDSGLEDRFKLMVHVALISCLCACINETCVGCLCMRGILGQTGLWYTLEGKATFKNMYTLFPQTKRGIQFKAGSLIMAGNINK